MRSTLQSLSRVRSLVTKRPAAEKLLSDSTDVGGMLFKASSRRSMFVVRWHVASKRSNSFARSFVLIFFHESNSMRFHNLDGCFWLSRSSDAVTSKLKQRLCIRRVPYATTCSKWVQPRMQNSWKHVSKTLFTRELSFRSYLNDSIQCFLIKYSA